MVNNFIREASDCFSGTTLLQHLENLPYMNKIIWVICQQWSLKIASPGHTLGDMLYCESPAVSSKGIHLLAADRKSMKCKHVLSTLTIIFISSQTQYHWQSAETLWIDQKAKETSGISETTGFSFVFGVVDLSHHKAACQTAGCGSILQCFGWTNGES